MRFVALQISSFLSAAGLLPGCSHREKLFQELDVTPIASGISIRYALPAEDSASTVLLRYELAEGRSRLAEGLATDTLLLQGFSESRDYAVVLYVMNAWHAVVDSQVVTVHAPAPPYTIVRATLAVAPDFDGINIKALNPTHTPMEFTVTATDAPGAPPRAPATYITREDTIDYTFRGYGPVPRSFGVCVKDSFRNTSDTITTVLSPLPDQVISKDRFFTHPLASDAPQYPGWGTEHLWDDRVDDYTPGWHTAESGNSMPVYTTFGMTSAARLTRCTLSNRPAPYAYAHANARSFTLWGSGKADPQDTRLPRAAHAGTLAGDWVCLGTFYFEPPPSGAPITKPIEEDKMFVAQGMFTLYPHAPPVRYIRLGVNETWAKINFAHVMELTFYETLQP